MRVPGRIFNNPLHPDRVRRIVGLLELDAASALLDVGCGAGAMMEMAIDAHGCAAFGMDPRPHEIEDARARLARFGPRVTLHAARLQDVELPATPFDAALCVGATHAFGRGADALPAAIDGLRRVVRGGGQILVGEGFWQRDPDPAYLEMTGIERASLVSHEENVERAAALGLELLYVTTSSAQEWDDFESLTWRATERLRRERPDDPEVEARFAHMQRWRTAYVRWGRATMGFGLYLWRLPGRASHAVGA